MTTDTHSTNPSQATMLAELAAIGELPADRFNVAQIHAERRPAIEALRAKIARGRPASDVTFMFDLAGEPCAYTDLRIAHRRAA